jgi:hypothetical protein
MDFGPYLDLTSTVDRLYNALWEVEYCRTIFALEDYYFKDTLYCDFWEYPDHIGYTWHLHKSSVEICAIAKDFHQKILGALPTFQRPVVTNWVIQHQIDELNSEIPGSIKPGRLLVSASLRDIVNAKDVRHTSEDRLRNPICRVSSNSFITALVAKHYYKLKTFYSPVPGTEFPTIDQFRQALFITDYTEHRVSAEEVTLSRTELTWQAPPDYTPEIYYLPPRPEEALLKVLRE